MPICLSARLSVCLSLKTPPMLHPAQLYPHSSQSIRTHLTNWKSRSSLSFSSYDEDSSNGFMSTIKS